MPSPSAHHQSLLKLARESLQPVAPVPPRRAPVLKRLPGVKCLIFDVYGTLLLSDRSPAHGDRNGALLEILEREGLEPFDEKPASAFHRHYQRALFDARLAGAGNPELDVRRIWRDLLGGVVDEQQIERVALAYECSVHQVWPVPGLRHALDEWRALGLPMGLVSNAQFYTPVLLEALLGGPLNELGFLSILSFFSYQCGESKPAPLMLNRLIGELERLHLRPEDALFVGNDLAKDIEPAAERGLRTVLCAFDERSADLDQPDSSSSHAPGADAVITRIDDLAALL